MRAGTNSNPRITFAEIEAARARLEAAAGTPVTIEPGGGHGAFSWTVSPAFGLSFGHLGKTKRDTVNALDRLTAAQLKMREADRRAARHAAPAVSHYRVLTTTTNEWRIGVDSPKETFEILAGLVADGYNLDTIIWEA